MTILQLQRRIAEVGRIRIGQQVATSSGKKRPAKLDTFRLTSPNRTRIEQAARLYGGAVTEWDAPAGQQWECVTQTDALAVIVPPSDMAFSQHYELWSGGGCQRRCDGVTDSISDGPCVCNPDNRECSIHTRLSVMLRDLPGLGIWRIDTSGYYAAVELQGAVDVMQMAARAGAMLPAQLRLEQRMVKRGGQTRRFPVPVLDVEISPAQLVGGGPIAMVDGTPGTVAIEAPREVVDGASPLTPVSDSVPERPVASVKEQAATQKPSRRRNQSVPQTGLKPRTVSEAKLRANRERVENDGPDSGRALMEIAQIAQIAQELLPDDDLATDAQIKKLAIVLKEADITDRAERLDWCSAAVGRRLASSKDLTRKECSDLIDLLEQDHQQQQQEG